jgi:stage 0 sporulation regulatory protein
MMCKDLSKLEDMISQTRIELMQIAEETGLNSEDTLLSSQKLDELITRYQKLIKESITSFRE